MDKVEYKIRADEIKALIGEGRFAEAVKIADTIDWKRVKSVAMLCTISDLYKINRRFEESRDILLMAYDRHPTGRAIVYSLCELAIKMGEFVQAVEYYKEFVRIAPRDTGRYILQYKLYEAQEVSLEERIAVLEEFKKHDYREKWVYELAYLYHRIGLTTECIETCDEMFLWLGDGNYVMKALELKALHEPLSPEQQDRYVRYKQKHGGYIDRSIVVNNENPVQNPAAQSMPGMSPVTQDTREMPPVSNDVEIKAPSVDVSAYNTMNLQAALAEELKPYIGGDEQAQAVAAQFQAGMAQPQGSFSQQDSFSQPQESFSQYQSAMAQPQDGFAQPQANAVQPQVGMTQSQGSFAQYQAEMAQQQANIAQPQGSFSQYQAEMTQQDSFAQQESFAQAQNTAAQAEAYGAQQAYGNTEYNQEPVNAAEPEIFDEDEAMQEDSSFSRVSGTIGEPASGSIEEVFFDTHEIHLPEKDLEFKPAPENREEVPAAEQVSDIAEVAQEEPSEFFDMEDDSDGQGFEAPTEDIEDIAYKAPVYENRPLEDEVPGAVIHPNASYNMSSGFDKMLSQDYDGQIKMAVEPEPEVEKQITGQISISEYIQNWEQFKKEQQERQLESVKKKVSDQTGDLFADYDEIAKAGLQEKIEKAIADAIKKEKQKRASGRSDWSRNSADIIDEAVDEVINGTEDDDSDHSFADEEQTAVAETEKKKSGFAREEFGDSRNEVKEEAGKAEDAKKADVSEENLEDPRRNPNRNRTRAEGRPDPRSRERNRGEDRNAGRSADRRPQGQRPDNQRNENQEPSDALKKKLKKHHSGNREIEERLRKMTPEEKELFGPYIHHKKSRRQIIKAIDNMSMEAFSGNVIVTGEEGAGTINLAKGLIRAVQASNSNFSGKVAKITANTLNKKRPAAIFEKLANGALIVQRAADIMPETAAELIKILKEEKKGIIIVMEDTKEDMNKFLDMNPDYKESFSVRVDIEALDDESLVAYAKQYALENEYAIDNLGILALHTKISERQTLDHDVTVSEVRDIVDDAIYYAEKRSVSHFVDIIVNKRFDENDMVILREKDFMH